MKWCSGKSTSPQKLLSKLYTTVILPETSKKLQWFAISEWRLFLLQVYICRITKALLTLRMCRCSDRATVASSSIASKGSWTISWRDLSNVSIACSHLLVLTLHFFIWVAGRACDSPKRLYGNYGAPVSVRLRSVLPQCFSLVIRQVGRACLKSGLGSAILTKAVISTTNLNMFSKKQNYFELSINVFVVTMFNHYKQR